MAFVTVVLILAALGAGVSARNLFDANQLQSRHHDEGKLIFSTLLWRHGDRTPAAFSPTDPYRNASSWPVGLGQLTALGKRQHYDLGKWLRRRYSGFLPAAYSEQDIYVRSTDVDRTLMSAQANLAALYPPSKAQIWNKNLLWQPIPVHTRPEASDYVLGGAILGCPKYDKLTEDLMNSPALVAFVASHQELIDYIGEHSGNKPTKAYDQVLNALLVRDTLYIERIYEKTLPSWTNKIYPSAELDELALLFYILPAFTEDLARIRVGYFLKELLDRSQAKVDKKLQPDRKVWVYSAHDINISTVLYGMGLFDGEYVQYAATLLFELREKLDGQVYLSIAYRRRAEDAHAEVLEIPGCGRQCKLSEMYRIYANILPTQDFATACRLD